MLWASGPVGEQNASIYRLTLKLPIYFIMHSTIRIFQLIIIADLELTI